MLESYERAFSILLNGVVFYFAVMDGTEQLN